MIRFLILRYAELLNWTINFVSMSDILIHLRFIPGFNKIRHFHGKIRAYKQFKVASRTVPAYQKHLCDHNFKDINFTGFVPVTEEIPITTKKNYVIKNSLIERCQYGHLPGHGTIIDESAGSSGTPTNWARGPIERKRNMRLIRFGFMNLIGKEPVLVINAFKLGVWAAGINFTVGSLKFANVKSTGPDIPKIVNTLLMFGTKQKYVIAAYPPFLKQLVDCGELIWEDFDITFIFGGESSSESMRTYFIEKGIRKMYSSFGASDLELNLANENDFTISVRRLLVDEVELRKNLLKFEGAIPMIFQYNPADFLVELNDRYELIYTICRPDYVSPKIRYNVMDKGHIIQCRDLLQIIENLGLSMKITKPQSDLPVLFHYGRSDMTLTYFGGNLGSNDIQEVIFNMPALAKVTNAFCMTLNENENADKELIISIELTDGTYLDENQMQDFDKPFFNMLSEINQDFKMGSEIAITTQKPKLSFFPFCTGPFINNASRTKLNYFN